MFLIANKRTEIAYERWINEFIGFAIKKGIGKWHERKRAEFREEIMEEAINGIIRWITPLESWERSYNWEKKVKN